MPGGKYKKGHHNRPIMEISGKTESRFVIIMQETDKSYLVRPMIFISDQKIVWDQAEWKRKTSVQFIEELGEVNIHNGYQFDFQGSLATRNSQLRSIEARCPFCGSFKSVYDRDKASNHWMYWRCSDCGKNTEKEKYHIYCKFDTTDQEIKEVEEMEKELIENEEFKKEIELQIVEVHKKDRKAYKCPECDHLNTEIYDVFNKIVICKQCGVYYTIKR